MVKDISLKKLDSGWGIKTNRDDLSNCAYCKNTLNHYDFYWCEIRDKFYCSKCIKTKNASEVCSSRQHTDWHIIKIVRDEDEQPNIRQGVSDMQEQEDEQ